MLATVRRDQLRDSRSAEDEEAFKAPIREQYEEQGNPYYSTARLWDDGVIDPLDTRTAVGLALSACANAPLDPVSLRRLPDVSEHSMFDTVLVANRGEIAVRVIRTLRRARHPLRRRLQRRRRRRAPRARGRRRGAARPGAAPASLPVDRAAARGGGGAPARRRSTPATASSPRTPRSRGRAPTPGWSSSARRPSAVEVMGDKIRAKQTVSAAGVPVVPGRTEPGMTDDDLVAAADEVGFPVLVKPSAGGGGKGMRLVHDQARPRPRLSSRPGARRRPLRRRHAVPRAVRPTAAAHRGAGARRRARHVVHLGERECSLQRRHQKVVEEAPSVLLDEASRARASAALAVDDRARRRLHRRRHGRVHRLGRRRRRVLLHGDEHPAAGRAPGDRAGHRPRPRRAAAAGRGRRAAAVRPGRRAPDGHAVEVRVYAEDPARGFLPTGGPALLVREPAGEGVRVDCALRRGRRRRHDVRPDAHQGHRLGAGPRHGAGPARPRAGRQRRARRRHQHRLPARAARPPRRAGRPARHRPGRARARRAGRARGAARGATSPSALDRLLSLGTGSDVDPWDRPTGWRLPVPARPPGASRGPDGAPLQRRRHRQRRPRRRVRVGDGEPVARRRPRRRRRPAAHRRRPHARRVLVAVDGADHLAARRRRRRYAVTELPPRAAGRRRRRARRRRAQPDAGHRHRGARGGGRRRWRPASRCWSWRR